MDKLFSDIENRTLSHCYLLFGEDIEKRREVLRNAAALISPLAPYVFSDKPKFQEVREMTAAMAKARISDELAVFIIPAIDGITPEGQNNLLKSLEEPTEGTLILMGAISEAGVLVTVRSRAKKLFMPVKTRRLTAPEYSGLADMLIAALLELKSSKDVARLAARFPREKDKMTVLVEVLGIIAEQLICGADDELVKPLADKYNLKNLANFEQVAREAAVRLYANVSPAAVGENILYGILEVCYKTR